MIILEPFNREGTAHTNKSGAQQWETLGGRFATKSTANVRFRSPELDNTKTITWPCHVDDKTKPMEASYDMILGMDLMVEIGIVVNTATRTIDWNDTSVPLCTRGQLQESYYLESSYHQAMEPEVLKEAESRQKRILDADYLQVDIDTHVQELDHLSTDEKSQLTIVLKSHPTLFGGGLGILKVRPISLELKPGAKPYHAKQYPVPQAYEGTTKREIQRLCDLGILKRDHDSKWAAATFIHPKKTGDVRVLTDFRRLNQLLKRRPFPLPKISDLLQKLKHFQYATAIDLSMGYYHIPLDKGSQRLCTTVLPWGKYRYMRLPINLVRLINDDDDGAEAHKDGTWLFKRILLHTGPLCKGQQGYNGSAWNVHVLWETGEITIEPLKNVEHDKYGCAAYACDKPELLEQPGWKQFKKHAQREKKLV
jgi:hypothetical protein